MELLHLIHFKVKRRIIFIKKINNFFLLGHNIFHFFFFTTIHMTSLSAGLMDEPNRQLPKAPNEKRLLNFYQ